MKVLIAVCLLVAAVYAEEQKLAQQQVLPNAAQGTAAAGLLGGYGAANPYLQQQLGYQQYPGLGQVYNPYQQYNPLNPYQQYNPLNPYQQYNPYQQQYNPYQQPYNPYTGVNGLNPYQPQLYGAQQFAGAGLGFPVGGAFPAAGRK